MPRGLRLGAALVFALASGAAVAREPADLYNTHCALCHQAAGSGAAGQFPRLAGRVGNIALDAKGRAYLVSVVASGLSGTITVDGTPLTGVMPPQAQIPPEELAQIFNYLLSLPPKPRARPKPFTAEEIKSPGTASAPSREQLRAQRQALVEARVIP